MLNTGRAVNYFARPLQIERTGGDIVDDYNDVGDLIDRPDRRSKLNGSIQPARGRDYLDMPEGARSETSLILSTTDKVQKNDVIIDGKRRYKVVHIFEATLGQYTRAGLGLLADGR